MPREVEQCCGGADPAPFLTSTCSSACVNALGTRDAFAAQCWRGTWPLCLLASAVAEVQHSPGALRCTLGREGGFLKEFG